MRLALERLIGSLLHSNTHLPSLEYPLSPTPRVAVLGATFRPETGIYSLPDWTPHSLMQLRPMALAGGWRDLRRAARLLLRGDLALPALLYPTIVLTPAADSPLTEHEHLQLWDTFGVPAWEQIRDPSGRLLAFECEARTGFHLAPEVPAAGLGGWLESGHCGCPLNRPLYRLAAPRAFAAAGD